MFIYTLGILMLENFHLAAIIKQKSKMRLLHIPLLQALQRSLSQSWGTQYKKFVENIEEIDFDPGYQPDEHQRFGIDEFELPSWLVEENSQTIHELETITRNKELIDSIKGIVAFARNEQREELLLFQNFTRSQVIRPGRFLFLQHDTFKGIENPGLTLADKLSAVYSSADKKLFFHHLRTVNTYLPISDFYEDASEEQIREVLEHDLLAPEDPDTIAVGANQWFRKRFAMLAASGVLDNYTANEIQERSNNYNVSIDIEQDKIIFPSDKAAAKKLLQFLNEEIFRGAITETLYETNSKRQAD